MTGRVRAVLAVAALLLAMPTAVGEAAADGAGVTVTLDQETRSAAVGDRFGIVSTIGNDSGHDLTGLVAHLDVVSTVEGVYVDPEDWSSERTVYLPTLSAGSSTTLDWSVQIVNEGAFVLYVTVTSTAGAAYVDTGPGLRLTSIGRRQLDAGGVLPVVVGVPALFAGLLVAVGVRRRRLR